MMNMNLRRLLTIAALVLAAFMLLSLSACSEEAPAATETPAADISLDTAQNDTQPSPSPRRRICCPPPLLCLLPMQTGS